jgi:3-methylfumaryl-CoA hydratase
LAGARQGFTEIRIVQTRLWLQAWFMSSAMPAVDAEQLAHWRTWLGRTEQRGDAVTAAPLNAWAATLDRDDPEAQIGFDVPPLAHWLYFLPAARQSQIGPDGHPERGSFLPPIPLPRRMWAGGRLTFHHALQVGDDIVRTSRIASVDAKSGRSGALAFVTVRHEITNERGLAITEEHDIVYRDAPRADAPAAAPQLAPADETFARRIVPDPVLLFRFSALTFNGHRIHYDRRYVTEVEGYPGLIVHGPLIATLLVDLLRRERPDARVQRFGFTAKSPLFDLHAFDVCGRFDSDRHVALWARNHEGALAMQASAELA